MRAKKIRKMIHKANQIEKQTGNLRNALIAFSNARSAGLDSNQIKALIQFVRQYVEHSAALIEQFSAAAQDEGIYNDVKLILDAAVQYFVAPDDIIPDELGLLGLIDDAYLTHCLIQSISDQYQAQTGCVLVPSDMTKANQLIRNLIGEPHASMLDHTVSQTLNGPSIQQSLIQLVQLGSMFNISGPDPVWGNASIDDIVTTRLGAMGVI